MTNLMILSTDTNSSKVSENRLQLVFGRMECEIVNRELFLRLEMERAKFLYQNSASVRFTSSISSKSQQESSLHSQSSKKLSYKKALSSALTKNGNSSLPRSFPMNLES